MDVDELRRRAELAEGFVALLTQQLHAAEQRDLAAQGQAKQLQAEIRRLTALVEGMQRQLTAALADLTALRSVAESRKKPKKDTPSAITTAGAAPDLTAGTSAAPDVPPRPDDRKVDKSAPERPKRPSSLPAHLPRHTLTLDVSACGKCGSGELSRLGDGEVSERYDYVPAQIRVERTVRATCRCRKCGAITTAPMPPTPVPGGSMTAPLLAHVAYSKGCLHLTLDRIRADLARAGVLFASATLCDAMGHVANLLEPVFDRIVDDLFASGLVHLDGTGVKVLKPGERGSYRGQFAVLSNASATAYFFTESKSGHLLADLLRVGTQRAYRGFLVADAASNMDILYADGTIIECGCWYHARDKFVEAVASAPFEAADAIARIAALFQVEHEADAACDSPQARLSRRQRDSVPVLDALRVWLDASQLRSDEGDDLWKAAQYCKNHWEPLTRNLTDGRIPLTNNQAERDLGPIGRGRKAWLFAGSDVGGRRLATIYTIIGTCLREDIDPRAYLTDVLPRLSFMNVNRGRGHLASLVPRAWKANRENAPPS